MRRSCLPMPVVVVVLVLVGAVPPAGADHEGGPPPEPCDMDIGLVIDRSGSMAGAKIAAAKTGSQAFVSTLSPVLDQSGLTIYSSLGASAVTQPLTPVHADTDAAIAAIFASGNTYMGEAIVKSHNDFLANGRPTARWIMVVLADGDSSDDPIAPANAAKADGIEIYSIAVQGSNPSQMIAIASTPPTKYYKTAATAADVETAFEQIADDVHQLCSDFQATEACDGQPVVMDDLSRVRSPATLVKAEWDFGDGTTYVDDPWTGTVTHTYTTAGVFDVLVEVTDSTGAQAHMQKEVRIMGCPVAAFACVTLTDPYLRVAFKDLSTDPDNNIDTWSWTLGDGTSAAGAGFDRHDYPAKGWYTVTLIITDEDGNSDESTNDCFADLNLPPVIDPQPVVVVWEGERVTYQVTGHDPDHDPTWFAWNRGQLPPPAAFDLETQGFEWQTRKGDAGTYMDVHYEIHDFEFMDAMQTGVIVLRAPEPPAPAQSDADDDGMPDQHDNCPYLFNPSQADSDGNGVGDACQGMEFLVLPPGTVMAEDGAPPASDGGAEAPDIDLDGVPDGQDNCPSVPNAAQADRDRDGLGDFCDPDLDGDGVPQLDPLGFLLDNCPYAANADQADRDGDGFGDACQGDRDSDRVPDEADNCLWIPNADQADEDGDGVGDACQALPGGSGAFLPGAGMTPSMPPAHGARGSGAASLAGAGVGAGVLGVGAVAGLLVALACILAVRRARRGRDSP